MSHVDSTAAAHTILVVDDHPGVRANVLFLLNGKIPGCRLLEADSGEDALALIEEARPCLIVLDIALPGMDGLEVARQVRQRCPHTQVVVHSARDLPIYRDAAAAAGVAAFVTKGPDSRHLVPVVQGLLRHRTT